MEVEDCCTQFRRQTLDAREELPVDWERTDGIVRNTAEVVFGVSSGERNVDKATQGEVQESIQKKRLTKVNKVGKSER